MDVADGPSLTESAYEEMRASAYSHERIGRAEATGLDVAVPPLCNSVIDAGPAACKSPTWLFSQSVAPNNRVLAFPPELRRTKLQEVEA